MRRFFLAGLLLFATARPSLAAFATDAGVNGAQFLKIGAGARPTAMGDAFTAIADDVNATYFNPAGLAQLKTAELTAMRTQWFQNIDYSFGAFAMPTSAGTFGISWPKFVTAVVIGRGIRYFSEGILAVMYGQAAIEFVQKNYGKIGLVFAIVIVISAVIFFSFGRRRIPSIEA